MSKTPEEVAQVVSAFINSVGDVRALAEALANDHPTLLGQAAKAMGLAVMMRALRNADYKPYDSMVGDSGLCERQVIDLDGSHLFVPHTYHDGRIDCATVVGAALMARQSFI